MDTRWLMEILPLLRGLERGILFLLVALVAVVPVVFALRWRALRKIAGDAAHWVGVVAGGLDLRQAADSLPLADGGGNLPQRLAAFALSHEHLCPDALERMLEAREIEDRREIERGLSFLGTVGGNAPFLGLTGTVFGILSSFQAMADTGSGGNAAVMASIAGALVATAAGLLAALPAVVLHNVLQERVDWILEESRQLRMVLVARSVQAVALAEDA